MKNFIPKWTACALALLALAAALLPRAGAQTALQNVPVTAKLTYDDGTPVAATIAIYDDATNAVVVSQALDANGKFAATIALDPARAYRVQATNASTGNPFPFMLKTLSLPVLPVPLVQQIFAMLAASEVDVTLAKADDSLNSYKLVALPPSAVTLKLSSCAATPSWMTVQSGVWGNVQPGSSWTCTVSVPAAATYSVSMMAATWGADPLQLKDGTAAATLTLQDTGSWNFSTAVASKAQIALPAGSSTLVITSAKCCARIADTVTLQ